MKNLESEFKIRLVREGAKAPTKAESGDLGYDLYACKDTYIRVSSWHGVVTVPSGIAVSFPEGWGGFLKGRSSLNGKGLHCISGVIDNGYRGEIGIMLINFGKEDIFIKEGERICQLVPIPVTDWKIKTVEEFEDTTERGDKGFGSSGK